MSRHPDVDAYIDSAAAFAQPILRTVREAMHAASPEIEEAMKWGMPSFLHKGRIIAHMAAFKAHATLTFWREEVVGDVASSGAMGQFGRITDPDELPSAQALTTLARKAIALAEQPRQTRKTDPAQALPTIPPDLAEALAQDDAARAGFEALRPSHQREYLQWIGDAKRPETRRRRIDQALVQLREGKSQNWKYERRAPQPG